MAPAAGPHTCDLVELPPLSPDDLRALAAELGLDRAAGEIAAASLPAIVLEDAGADPAAESRVGGIAHLADSDAWPRWRARPLASLAQIRLEDVKRFDVEDVLPGAGFLTFFWDSGAVGFWAGGEEVADAAGWGFDPADAGSALVRHLPAAPVQAQPPPGDLAPDARLAARAVVARPRLTIPPPEPFVARHRFSEAEIDAYYELVPAVTAVQGFDDEGPLHQLLGHPDQMQGDMQLEAQLVSNGLYLGDASGYDDPRAQQLATGATSWRLLFQLGSDEERLGAMWGDVGRLYFWIRDADLRARRFDAAWLILQCA